MLNNYRQVEEEEYRADSEEETRRGQEEKTDGTWDVAYLTTYGRQS